MNSTGGAAWENKDLDLAESMTSLTSFTPALTAERVKKSLSRVFEIIWARVVLPTPGGPQRMNEERLPESIMLRRIHPGPTRCSWPTYSSRFLGLIRSGRGGNIFFIDSDIYVSCANNQDF